MGLIKLLLVIGILVLMLAGGLAWIFAGKYVALAVIILVVWNVYKKSDKGDSKSE